MDLRRHDGGAGDQHDRRRAARGSARGGGRRVGTLSDEAAVLTVLGSGTCIPDAVRHSAAFHLESGAASILLDCGPGTVHGLAAHGVAWSRLTHVAVSHFHTDHVGDLAGLLFALAYGARPRRTEPLVLVGPTGLGAFVDRLASAFGAYVREPNFGLEIIELGGAGASGPLTLAEGLALRAHPTPHTETSLAYRIEGPWGALGYTGDTGPSEEVAEFLTGCRALVAECAFDDPPETELHLSPALLAEIAHRARPELLVVTHVYPPLAPSEAVRRVSERYPGRVVAGADGVRIRFGARGADVDPPGGAVYT